MKRLLVAGSRTFEPVHDENGMLVGGWSLAQMYNVLNQASYCLDSPFDIIIHGGARGVDRMAGRWAASKSYPVEVYPAKWDELGKRAGYVRNAEMVAIADAAIIVWDGQSKGTQHTLDLMTQAHKPYVLVVRQP